MQQTNGSAYTNGAATGGGTPAAVPTAVTQSGYSTRNGSTEITVVDSARYVDRFMPVMDIQQALQRRQLIVDATSQLMRKDVDYGKIPGTERETLLQPGADKLCNLFGIVIEYEITRRIEDWTGEEHGGEPFFFYEVRGKAFRGEFLMGEGTGSCNSWEKKYRWRNADRICPQCGKAAIRKSRPDAKGNDGGWYCWRRIEGCGAQFGAGDRSIEGQEVGRRPNPDVAELVNTILKMAHKRAKIAAAINATSASEFFTQDVEDFTPPEEQPIDTGGAPEGSPAAAYVAQQKIARGDASSTAPWRTMREMSEMYQAMRESVGEVAYRAEMERWGWVRFQDMKNAIDAAPDANTKKLLKQKAIEIYVHLEAIVKGKVH